jgi:small subunit ribosomal protein S1
MSTASMNPTTEDFAALLTESFAKTGMAEGRVVEAIVTGVTGDFVTVDVGLKTEGRIKASEFSQDDPAPKVGAMVEVYLERIENALGDAVLSRDKARREEAWTRLERVHERKETVKGAIVGRVKGGFTVDLGGVNAFLPGSQVDIRPIRDVGPLMNQVQPFAILKMDRPRGNIVVSRRAVLEESRAEQRAEIVGNMFEGERRKGVVKNITDYGAFVDLGGIDGLLHVTDMSWKRISHPSQVVEVGQEVDVQIIKINPETQRISLGMKQLMSDPWEGVGAKYPIGAKLRGRVTNITDYGAFVELEDGVEGLIHVSEMSWTKKNGLGPELDGMVHINDLDWNEPGEEVVKRYNKGDTVRARVLDIDIEKERISLGVKQLSQDPAEAIDLRRNSVVTCIVTEVTSGGIEVSLADGAMKSFIRKADLSRDRSEQRPERFAVGDKVDALVAAFEKGSRKVTLSVKALEIRDEKEAVEQYGSADSGASLGDILGAALKGAGKKE